MIEGRVSAPPGTDRFRGRGGEIVDFILRNVEQHPGDIVRLATGRFGLSRQMVNRYVQRLVEAGYLEREGETRSRRYALRCIVDFRHTLPVDKDITEDEVWREYVVPHLTGLPRNVLQICQYGFTEMFNNVIEHSEADRAKLLVQMDAVKVRLMVFDYGIGIFNKLARDRHITDSTVALMELLKGKLTTAPSGHSGQGIFFTSKMFDCFMLSSGRLRLLHVMDGEPRVEVEERRSDSRGTTVGMQIGVDSPRTWTGVFDRFSAADLEGFSRTHLYVKLSGYRDEGLVSRSQARKLVARLEEFEEVVLDFQDVEAIGQAFADEVFRVFHANHPTVRLVWRNTNPEIDRMIQWVGGGGSVEQPRLPL